MTKQPTKEQLATANQIAAGDPFAIRSAVAQALAAEREAGRVEGVAEAKRRAAGCQSIYPAEACKCRGAYQHTGDHYGYLNRFPETIHITWRNHEGGARD